MLVHIRTLLLPHLFCQATIQIHDRRYLITISMKFLKLKLEEHGRGMQTYQKPIISASA